MDNATFFHNLPPDLRRAVLSDMDDSLINHLPDEMRVEAQALRQERDSRRRQMLEQRHAFLERMMEEAHLRSSAGGGADASIVPPTSWPHMTSQGMRYAVVNLNPHMLDGHVLGGLQSGGASYLGRAGGTLGAQHARGSTDQHSKQMLDQEALTCLLVLLFLDQSKLHNNRLHRILKNLSQHSPTRAWILSSLLDMIKEMRNTHDIVLPTACPMPPPLTSRPIGASSGLGSGEVSLVSSSEVPVMISSPQHHAAPRWLDISINAALGSHAKIFQFENEGATNVIGSAKSGQHKVNIHPLAAATICHNILDLLIFLGRHFGSSFLSAELLPKEKVTERKEEANDVVSNFWQILLKLDGAIGRKGKGAMKPFKYLGNKGLMTAQELFSNSIIGQLMDLFSHDIISNNIPLIDKLLRLLSIASGSIPRTGLKVSGKEAPPTSSLEAASKRMYSSGEQSTTSALVSGPPPKPPAEFEDVLEKGESNLQFSIVAPPLLGHVISVLTSGRCSEEGLEEATILLTNLSKCSIPTREHILFMLLDGVRTIGKTLCAQITALDDSVNAKIQEERLEKGLLAYQQPPDGARKKGGAGGGVTTSVATGSGLSGIVLPTVSPEEQHTDHSHDLHIPSMEPLTCKGSQQSFFVRMLKVVCQLRESAQMAINAAASSKGPPSNPLTTTQARTPATLHLQPLEGQPTSSLRKNEESSGESNDSEMATGVEQKSVFLQMLSQQLELEELWLILSRCLDDLSHTDDTHAVFVLQPTVEAFFLVHANHKEDGQKNKKKPSHGSTAAGGSRFGRLSSSHFLESESNPASPSPFSPLPGTPGPGELDIDPFAHLPPDTAKFLKFAGNHLLTV